MSSQIEEVQHDAAVDAEMDYHTLNAKVNLLGPDGKLQLGADKEAARQFFLQHVNQNTVFFHDLEEKLDYLVKNDYYESEVLEQYSPAFIKRVFKRAYGYNFRFETFMGAYKYYTSYTLKTFDGKRYLERYEDRVSMVALYLAQGHQDHALRILDEMMTGRYQPATPTFLNAGKAQRGELVSCFLLRVEDNMESISRAINSSLQLSKRGGGVALNLTNLREAGAPIKKIENQSSGVVPVMKLLEDSFSYANQLGARQGAGAVYLNAHHPDIMTFLDTKRENADEKIRIKTLSLGVVVPDVTFRLARDNEDMYLFSPYDVQRVYGVPFCDINVTEKYDEMVLDHRISKKKIKARALFQAIAEIQFESGYPYLMFEDNVNRASNLDGKVTMSNLCVTGETRILTDKGYRQIEELFETQEDFNIVADVRARDMDIAATGVSIESSTKVFKTAENAAVFSLKTSEGFEIRATEWHKFYAVRDGRVVKLQLNELEIGDKLLVQPDEGAFGSAVNTDLAYLAGAWAADGTFSPTSAKLSLYGEGESGKADFVLKVESAIGSVLTGRDELVERRATLTPKFGEYANGKTTLSSAPLKKVFAENGIVAENKVSVPEFVWNGAKETQVAFIDGLFSLDGTVYSTKENTSVQLGSVNRPFLVDVQRLLLNLGVYSRIYASKNAGVTSMPNGKSGVSSYETQPIWSLRISDRTSCDKLVAMVEWKKSVQDKYDAAVKLRSDKAAYSTHKFTATISSIEFDGVEDVYDVTVDNGHSVVFNGLSTGQCSEILQVSTPSIYKNDLSYDTVGKDISCNLGSMNVAKAFAAEDFTASVETMIRALTAVSDMSNIDSVPSIENGNAKSHAIGLGQMNLHGFFAKNAIHYNSPEAVDFTNIYFYSVLFAAMTASNKLAKERKVKFEGFDKSTYADGSFFSKYIDKDWSTPETDRVAELFAGSSVHIPTPADWVELRDKVAKHGLYNAYLTAVAPTGSISYLSNATASILPVVSPIEVRKEGKIGRVVSPAPYLSEETIPYYKDAYQLGPEAIIDVVAAATQHTDQGISCTLFYSDKVTTRDLNKAYVYAWRKGLKTLYYMRVRSSGLNGTESDNSAQAYCESCQL